jgi:ribose transport system ATP-binding protein
MGGEVTLDGRTSASRLRGAVAAGIFLVPEDRKGRGLLLDFSIAENITLPNLGLCAGGS